MNTREGKRGRSWTVEARQFANQPYWGRSNHLLNSAVFLLKEKLSCPKINLPNSL